MYAIDIMLLTLLLLLLYFLIFFSFFYIVSFLREEMEFCSFIFIL